MSPRLRALSLTAHIIVSVGWLGTVAGALVLSVAGLTADDTRTAGAAYLGLELVAWSAILPLAIASLLTGLVHSLGTPWGLFRHYWVLAKLTINLFATLVLLLYLQTLGRLADEAPRDDPSPALHSFAALLLLVLATALAVFKPRGLTPYGWRKREERRRLTAHT